MSGEIAHRELSTERLLLRPLCISDVEPLCELAGAEEVYRTTINIPHPYTTSDAEAWVERSLAMWADGSATHFAIVRRDTDDLIGGVGLTIERRHDRAELGFWVGVPYWGRGYTTEASRAVLAFGFGELRLERIWAGHLAGNEASGRVQQKLGMTREGVLRRHFKKDGVFHDDVVYAITREEWEGLRDGVGPPDVETERLVLRSLRHDDVDALVEINRHKEVADGVLSIPHPYTRHDAINRLGTLMGANAAGTALTWMITLDGEPIGICGFDVNDRHAHGMLGYTVHPGHWGRGYASEAVRGMIRHAFEERSPPMHRLFADHYPENPASGRVCEKAGMTREGLQRGAIRKNEEFRDLVRWAIIRNDWLERR